MLMTGIGCASQRNPLFDFAIVMSFITIYPRRQLWKRAIHRNNSSG